MSIARGLPPPSQQPRPASGSAAAPPGAGPRCQVVCVWCSYFWRSWGGMSFKMNLWKKKIQTNETPYVSKAWKFHKISKCHPVWLSQVRVQPRMSAGCQQGSLSCLHEGRSARISTGWDKYVETQQLECGLCIFWVLFWNSGWNQVVASICVFFSFQKLGVDNHFSEYVWKRLKPPPCWHTISSAEVSLEWSVGWLIWKTTAGLEAHCQLWVFV